MYFFRCRIGFGLAAAICLVAVRAASAQAPVSLQRLVSSVVNRNLEIEAARYRVERARAEQVAAALRPNPTLAVTAENLPLGGAPFNRLYEISTTYTETIELGGKRKARMLVADLGVSAAEAQLADVLRQKAGEAKRLYFEVLLAQHQVDVAMENRELFSRLLELNQARFEEGALAEGDLLKVRLERFKFDAAIRQAELEETRAMIRLSQVYGEPLAKRTLIGVLEYHPIDVSLETLKQAALANRPDARAADLEIDSARERVVMENARRAPDIAPFAGYKRVATDNTILFGVSLPLRFRDQNQGGIARAEADRKIATANAQLVRNRIIAEVEAAYRAYETSMRQVTTFQNELIRQADESRSITLAAYEEGATNLLPVLEAQRTRSEIQQQYYRTLFDYQTSIVELELAIGRDLQ